MRFGILSVLRRDENDSAGRARWQCRCACGDTTIVSSWNLVSGRTQSCGCQIRQRLIEANTKHGHATGAGWSKEFNAWVHMRQRCTNPRNKSFSDYGGRGIAVSPRWESFEAFLADMGPAPHGAMLDRIDNNKGYELGNCRWTTRIEQNRNRRDTILVGGRSLRSICEERNLSFTKIYKRIRRGWTAERALEMP